MKLHSIGSDAWEVFLLSSIGQNVSKFYLINLTHKNSFLSYFYKTFWSSLLFVSAHLYVYSKTVATATP